MNTMSLTHDAPNESERIAVLVAHGGTLFAWFLAPLLVYLVKRNDSRYVEFQALQSLLWSVAGTLIAGVALLMAWRIMSRVAKA